MLASNKDHIHARERQTDARQAHGSHTHQCHTDARQQQRSHTCERDRHSPGTRITHMRSSVIQTCARHTDAHQQQTSHTHTRVIQMLSNNKDHTCTLDTQILASHTNHTRAHARRTLTSHVDHTHTHPPTLLLPGPISTRAPRVWGSRVKESKGTDT